MATFFYAQTSKSEAPAPIPTTEVIVAARDVPQKSLLTRADIILAPTPKQGPDTSARIVLERVPILARTLSIYVIRTDAATAERIGYLTASGGTLQLLLRGPKDDRASGTAGATFRTIYPEFRI